eukprot:8976605-Alexandrium_andersonii.AAC.1
MLPAISCASPGGLPPPGPPAAAQGVYCPLDPHKKRFQRTPEVRRTPVQQQGPGEAQETAGSATTHLLLPT